MGGESVQLSQAQKRRMEAMSMNMGTRIVCGYLASLLFLGDQPVSRRDISHLR